MKINVVLRQAFTEAGQGGNTAGIVFEKVPLPEAMRQEIARRVGVSETVFVHHDIGSRRARLAFYTPIRPIARCGHATVAAFSLLGKMKRLPFGPAIMETEDGHESRIYIAKQRTFMEQPAPVVTALPQDVSEGEVRRALHLTMADVVGPMRIASTGNPFLIVNVRDEAALQVTKPSSSFTSLSAKLGVVGAYLFALTPERELSLAATRMFAPLYGIQEESATGSAAGVLAGYLDADKSVVLPSRFSVMQGQFMEPPSPSRLFVHLSYCGDQLATVRVGGGAVHKGVIKLDI